MKIPERPVLIGAGQFTQQKRAIPALDPVRLMAVCSRSAMADAGINAEMIDTLCIINIFSWVYDDPCGSLAELIGAAPSQSIYGPIGGNTPQMMVNRFAREIAAGKCKAVMIAGAEAVYSLARAAKGNTVLDWPKNEFMKALGDGPVNFDVLLRYGYDLEMHSGEILPSLNRVESAYDIFLPQYMYPVFETSLRASARRSPRQHREHMNGICRYLSGIAAQNPYAWTRAALNGDVTAAAPDNRYIGYPYTKLMNANINVDQAAAVIMTGESTAMRLGIPRSQWVYPLGGADLSNIWYVSQRPCLHDSPAITEGSRIALQQANLTLGDIDIFDIYSCFPSAFEIARQALGIAEDDGRDLTLTGGLPYFGGPGNNYSLHAIAEVVKRLRRSPQLKAIVTANGWYNTKHSIGVYGCSVPANPWDDRDDSDVQARIDSLALPGPVERAQGELKVGAYVIRHLPDGRPEGGTVIGTLRDGRRALADIDASLSELEHLREKALEGCTGKIRFDSAIGRNVIRLT